MLSSTKIRTKLGLTNSPVPGILNIRQTGSQVPELRGNTSKHIGATNRRGMAAIGKAKQATVRRMPETFKPCEDAITPEDDMFYAKYEHFD